MFKDLNPPKPITRPRDSPNWRGTDSPQPKATGLGDRVERIAQPIARAIDKVAGTNIQGCGACQKRKEYLNEKFPSN
tara:strand:+ start:931 stop:1161 length:231 start_codon:yes stop_codon:yes gene_type:complete